MKEIEESHDEFENDENTNKESISTLNLKIEDAVIRFEHFPKTKRKLSS